MNISFNGFGENTVTFEADASLTKAGVPVTITAEGKAAPCTNGDKICGVAVNVRAGYAAVQLQGFVQLPADSAIDCGFNTVSATADGKVAADDNGREVLVITSDGDTVGFIL